MKVFYKASALLGIGLIAGLGIAKTAQAQSRDIDSLKLQNNVSQTEKTEAEIAQTNEGFDGIDEAVADSEIIEPGRNYLGIGGSLGLIEDAYGDFGAAAVITKVKLFELNDNNDVSIRPSMLVGKDVTFTFPVTVDILLGDPEARIAGKTFVPYGGLGTTFTTDSDVFYFNLVGGMDIPFNRFTINAETNVGFLDDIALGLRLGIGYNF